MFYKENKISIKQKNCYIFFSQASKFLVFPYVFFFFILYKTKFSFRRTLTINIVIKKRRNENFKKLKKRKEIKNSTGEMKMKFTDRKFFVRKILRIS